MSNFEPSMLRHQSDSCDFNIYVNNLVLYGPAEDLIDTTVLGLKRKFEVTKMGQLHCVLGIEIPSNCDSIELSPKALINILLEELHMNNLHWRHLHSDPNHLVMKTELVLEAEEYCLYQSIIGSCMFLLTFSRPDLLYPILYLP
jgi:hypothetical protein